ncbi:hypothetical protein DFH11DRAFT_83143 [Phellopilus nigrolimitatus]|nr:hypothetical protein DFH11DRAFT_83143 [Phellopilus nigrolimitatus]
MTSSPPPSAAHIQSHLYHAFLHARTADVALRVRGSWHGLYHLHRVVLIQAGFFKSLFDGGFREGDASQSARDEVSVTFDDPNITRAAFELCISRLYGGGPDLYLDPRLKPSRDVPLTPSFPRPAPPTDTPAAHHPATPRFLLSLLATAIYLAVPSLVSQTILLVLNSLGPHTVIRYLNFAIGKGIGDKGDNELDAAVGLEHVCVEFSQPDTARSNSVRSAASKQPKTSIARVLSAEALETLHKEQATDTDSSFSDSDAEHDRANANGAAAGDNDDDDDDDGPVFMYGAASNKIGEAAACWLCRWGADMLLYEEAVEPAPPGTSQTRTGPARRRATESCAGAPPPGVLSLAKEHVPRIWRRGGLDARWVRAVLSADAFFVRDERERYDVARRAVELRRRAAVDDAEEREWAALFADGIHYMHMPLDDLIEIAQDVSPTTGTRFAPAAVVQAAHWNQSMLRHHVTGRTSAACPKDGSLGLAQTTAELLAASAAPAADPQRAYYPVPADASSRIGDTTGLEGAPSMDELFAAEAAGSGTTKGKGLFTPHTPATFFGIAGGGRSAAACAAADAGGAARWSAYPPMRFGVEFWGLDALREKARLNSQTVWYAGSLYNVYVQVVRKKGLQLGMYLHRLSSIEAIPAPSAPPPPLVPAPAVAPPPETAGSGGSRLATVQPVTIPTSLSTPTLTRFASRGTTASSRPTTPASSPGTGGASPPSSSSPVSAGGLHAAAAAGRPPAQPYRDPRESVRAHFTLLCAAPAGAALTRFASAPDAFAVGRSWGWKSSALQTEEHLSGAGAGSEGQAAGAGREVSLRATVVIGVV